MQLLPEVVDSEKAGLPPNLSIQTVITPGRGEALTFIRDNVTDPPPHTFISFSNGSHIPDKGAGAAAVEFHPQNPQGSTILSVRVGDADDTSPYLAELTGLELAVANAQTKAPRGTTFFWFITDNQVIIRDVTGSLRAKPGMSACARIRRNLSRLIRAHPGLTAAILWCPSKKDVEGLELADKAAKAATLLPQVIETRPSQDTVLRRIKQQLQDTITGAPPKHVLDRLMGFYNPLTTYKALSKLPRSEATAVAQLRSGHCPLNAYLHRFKALDTMNCDLCKQKEDVCHLLTSCKKFVGIRQTLFNAARKKKTSTNRITLLTTPALFKDLGNFVRQSFRLYKARHKRYIKPGPPPPRRPRPNLH